LLIDFEVFGGFGNTNALGSGFFDLVAQLLVVVGGFCDLVGFVGNKLQIISTYQYLERDPLTA
jgi:hypothetical protein